MNLKNCDAFLLAEDFLYQRGLMFSPAFFRTNILEGIQELANLSSKSGKPFGFHADGDFSPILGDLRKIGIKFIHGFDLVNLNHQDIKGFSLIVPKGIFLTDFPILWDDDPPD
ncbi:MAG: hypothetical protein NUV68_07885 [Caldiserica bacterium]|nr:hypothetical protein [Caldisericota bacterium]